MAAPKVLARPRGDGTQGQGGQMSRIVVVEDEPAIAELVAINMRHAGHEVSLAATDDRVLGVTIIGPHASDLISEAVLAVEMDAEALDIGLSIHPHPTLSEGLMEAAKAALGEAIHVVNR